MFGRLAKLHGREDWTLDHVGCYGGYVIEQHDKTQGMSNPFGCFRRNSKEMYLSMWMACQVLENIKYEEQIKS